MFPLLLYNYYSTC